MLPNLPFLVALYKNSGSQFFCAGNLISSRHVLTAAHCIHKKISFKSLQPDAINVSMGSGLMSTGVKRIKIHPKWRHHTNSYDADLAILFLDSEVHFSSSIQPVCLANSTDVLTYRNGTVVSLLIIYYSKS